MSRRWDQRTQRPRFGVNKRLPVYQNIKFNIRKALTVEESVCAASPGSSFPASTATSSHLICSTSGDEHNHNTAISLATPLLWIFRVRCRKIVCKCLYFYSLPKFSILHVFPVYMLKVIHLWLQKQKADGPLLLFCNYLWWMTWIYLKYIGMIFGMPEELKSFLNSKKEKVESV